jgi:serine/threonine-protein kinase
MSFVQANAQGGLAGAPGRTFERVSVVKALAGRKVESAVAHAFSPAGAELVVVERYAGLDGPMLEALEGDARATMSLRHPNVATVRDVWREDAVLCVATEYVEGESLEELRKLAAGGKELTIEVGVRVIVDVLAALSAVHGRAAGAAHGEVTAQNVIVGFDGTTRVVRPYRGRAGGKVAEADWYSYASPELVRGGAPDVRADLYAVGVLLWETLSRRKLFPKATREGRSARSMPVGKPAPPPDATWAAPLGAVAERALANDPSARYTTAAEMAAAVRLAVRSKLAMPPRVSAAVDKLAGERVLARRSANALPDASVSPGAETRTPGEDVAQRPSRPPVPKEATLALDALKPSSRPPPPLAPAASPKPAPVALPKAPPVPMIERPAPRPAAPALKLAPPTPTAAVPVRRDVAPKPPPKVITPPPPPIVPVADSEPPISVQPLSEDDSMRISEVFADPTLPKATPAPPVFPAPTTPVAPPVVAAPIVVPAAPEVEAATPAAIVTPTPIQLPFVCEEREPRKSKRGIIIAIVALVAIVAVAGVVKIVSSPRATETTTTTSTSATANATTRSTVGTTTTTTTTTAASVTTSAPTATAPPSATTTAEPDTSTSAGTAPVDSRRPRTRPRPTYDPMGI